MNDTVSANVNPIQSSDASIVHIDFVLLFVDFHLDLYPRFHPMEIQSPLGHTFQPFQALVT